MGVPGLFAFLRRRYPLIAFPPEEPAPDDPDARADCLYVDMNHIIHSCTHANLSKDASQVTEAEMMAGMGAYLDALCRLVLPKWLLVIAVDGVAPRAKMNQQRTRRFLSAYVSELTERVEEEVRREMASEAGGELHIPKGKKFDSNIITPGTAFMSRVAAWLRTWAQNKVQHDARMATVKIVVSDASEPGEGEHKIMRFIRSARLQPGYNPNARHVIYGQDADLLLLALLCHEPHMTVMREDMNARNSEYDAKTGRRGTGGTAAGAGDDGAGGGGALAAFQACMKAKMGLAAAVKLPEWEAVDIAVLRECLQWEFSSLCGPPTGPSLASTERQQQRLSEATKQLDVLLMEQQDEEFSAGGRAPFSSDDESQEDDQDGAVGGRFGALGNGNGAAATAPERPKVDFEVLLHDLVVLTYLVGNDFLPAIPSLDIYDNPTGLDVVMTIYRETGKLGGPITSSGCSINMPRLQRLLQRLSCDEEAAFRRRAEYRRRKAARAREQQAAQAAELIEALGGPEGISMGELPPGTDIDAVLSGVPAAVASLLGLDPSLVGSGRGEGKSVKEMEAGELVTELATRVAARVQDRLMGGDPWADDPIGMDLPGYRERHYKTRFPEAANHDVDAAAAKICRAFLDGICWVYRYYSVGPAALQWDTASSSSGTGRTDSVEGASWTWCYPYHYAPLMQDLANSRLLSHNAASGRRTLFASPIPVLRYEPDLASCPLDTWAPKSGPVRPLLQLMCVLPGKSAAEALPEELATLVMIAQTLDESGKGKVHCHALDSEEDEPEELAAFEFSGNMAESVLLLADTLSRAFPSEVEPLVDLSGKRWLHTGVVRLPFAEPRQVARVIQHVLRGGAAFSHDELARNCFGPADVIVAQRVVSQHGCSTSTPAYTTVSSHSNSHANRFTSHTPDASTVWQLLVSKPSSPPPTPAPRKALPGALSMLVQHHDAAATEVAALPLDIAGLPAPEPTYSLLPGAEPPKLTMTPAAWRKLSKDIDRNQSFVNRALGIGSGGRGGGRGGRQPGRGGSNRGRMSYGGSNGLSTRAGANGSSGSLYTGPEARGTMARVSSNGGLAAQTSGLQRSGSCNVAAAASPAQPPVQQPAQPPIQPSAQIFTKSLAHLRPSTERPASSARPAIAGPATAGMALLFNLAPPPPAQGVAISGRPATAGPAVAGPGTAGMALPFNLAPPPPAQGVAISGRPDHATGLGMTAAPAGPSRSANTGTAAAAAAAAATAAAEAAPAAAPAAPARSPAAVVASSRSNGRKPKVFYAPQPPAPKQVLWPVADGKGGLIAGTLGDTITKHGTQGWGDGSWLADTPGDADTSGW